MVIDLDPTQLKSRLDEGETVFLKIWKRGCGPCKLSEPAMKRIGDKYGESMTVAQICLDDHEEMSAFLHDNVLPAFFFFKDKKKCGELIGFKGLAKLESLISDHHG